MKKKVSTAVFVIFCILIDYLGKIFSVSCQLPLWLDSVGTVLTAYVLGPVSGAIVGATNNILYGMQEPVAYIYSITSISIGVLVGIFARRRFFDSIFLTTSLSVLVTTVTVVISTVLNFVFYNGMTGNIWGDGVIGYMTEKGYSPLLCYIAGEFYVDFMDKLLSLYFLYFVLYLVRKRKEKKNEGKEKQRKNKKLKMGSVLLVIVLLAPIGNVVVYATGTSQSKEEFESYVQTVYNSENGLACGEANTVAQTRDGVLWIGTYAGLYRYSGNKMRLMDEYDSVKNVNCLYVDEEGRLWIGTNDNGVSICINGNIANVIDEESGLPSNSVRCIVQGADGLYYIGTSEGMQILSLNSGLSMIKEIREINYAFSMDADDTGCLATVNADGQLFLLKNKRVVDREVLYSSGEQYMSCAFDEKGQLYVSTSTNHVYIYDVSSGSLVQKGALDCGELLNINYLYFSEENQLFLCADNGIGYFDEQKRYHSINTGEFNNSIDWMTMDYQGNMWFASSRMGLLRLCKSCFTDLYSVARMEKQVVNAVERWNDCLYVGTDTGLNIINLENNQKVENDLTKKLTDIRIRSIKKDSNNHLWICTYGNGLWEIDGESIQCYNSENGPVGDRARVVLQMKDGTIVIASNTGISYIQNGEIVSHIGYNEGISNTMILSLVELEDGTLLAGTDGDGIVVLKDRKVISKVTRENGLTSDVILRVVPDNSGEGSFVVASNGLSYMDEDYTIKSLSNFPYFNNYDIWQSEDGRLFVLSSAGIYVVKRDNLLSGEELEYKLLDVKSGLTSALTVNAWNYCEDNQYLYLSSDSGVFMVDMEHYNETNKSYRMMVDSVKVDDVTYTVERGTPVSVPRDMNKLEIFPEVINYSIEDPYVRYYMEGIDKTKTTVQQSELTSIVYKNIPSGTYTFHLQVLDESKTKVLEEGVYIINKEKEIYDNRWFLGYMLGVLILAVAWLTWFLVRTQIQRTINIQKKELTLAKNKIEMGNQTILAIARTVDAKDVNTSHHSQRVAEYSVMIARELGMSEEECENLRKIALLHDIGKIGVADSVLNKPGRLDDEEYAIMKSHVEIGAEILKDFTLVDNVWEGALYHHERYDGKGYVSGLKGEEIPINARIIGIADAFDAMTANRVYRKKLDFQVVLEELRKGRGTQFDPKCVDILLRLIQEGKINVEEIYHEAENK